MRTFMVNRDKGIQNGDVTVPVFTQFDADENDPRIVDWVSKGHVLDVAAEAERNAKIAADRAAEEAAKITPADDPQAKPKPKK